MINCFFKIYYLNVLAKKSCKWKIFKFNYRKYRLRNYNKEITEKKNSSIDLCGHFFREQRESKRTQTFST